MGLEGVPKHHDVAASQSCACQGMEPTSQTDEPNDIQVQMRPPILM